MSFETPPRNSSTDRDGLALLLLAALTACFAFIFVDFSTPPFEDAAMLMRYADHVAHGKGIVWNIGEAPVDGATDFMFMLVVAFVRALGSSLETAVRMITVSSHFVTAGLIYWAVRRFQHSGFLPAFLSAAYFAIGPGLFLSAAYFGTPFFVLVIALAWLAAQSLMLPGRSTLRNELLFSFLCLLAGLVRPEGVLISVFMLASVGVAKPFKDFVRIASIFGAVFIVLGGAYFAWRWNYFGHPLPNPFYKKGGGHIYLDSLVRSIQHSAHYLYPFALFYLLSLRRGAVRQGLAFLVPIAGTVSMWILLSDEMNFGARFQYPVLAIAALSWYPLARASLNNGVLPSFPSLGLVKKLAAAAVLVGVFAERVTESREIPLTKDGRYDVAIVLSDYADRGYTIATTEAGLLPLYSRWRAVDTWGLNDSWIAHNGAITGEYLEKQHPDVLVWFEGLAPLDPAKATPRSQLWARQVETLREYAVLHNFTLAAVYGVAPADVHYYYVRPGIVGHDDIVQRIRSTEYAWYGSGIRCENFAPTRPQ